MLLTSCVSLQAVQLEVQIHLKIHPHVCQAVEVFVKKFSVRHAEVFVKKFSVRHAEVFVKKFPVRHAEVFVKKFPVRHAEVFVKKFPVRHAFQGVHQIHLLYLTSCFMNKINKEICMHV